jgi:hypothetical protein
MYKVDVDDSEVRALTRSAEAFFRHLPDRALRAVQRAAEFERDRHPYQNRTGRLEHSTMARPMPASVEGEFDIDLLMGMEYASYVDALGYSRIRDAAEMADAGIARVIAKADAKLGSM